MPHASDQKFDAAYMAIGKFLVNWSMFEYEMYRLVKIIYTNCQGELIPESFPDEIAGKIKLVERALSIEPRLTGIATDGLKLTKHIWRHRVLRNLLVHGSVVGIATPSLVVTFLQPPRQIGKGPLKRAKLVPFKLSQIEKEAQEMEDRGNELGFFSAQFQSALPNPPGSHSP